MLTKELLDAEMDYDAEEGIFSWRIWKNYMERYPGKEVTLHKRKDGHYYMDFNYTSYRVEQLVILTTQGTLTPYNIYHLDNDFGNNVLSNLLVVDPFVMGDEAWEEE